MEGCHHVNCYIIICRKGAMHRTEIEKPFLVAKAAKGFNTNLVHFLLLYHVISSNVHVCSYGYDFPRVRTCTLNGFAWTKSRVRKIIIYEGLNVRWKKSDQKLYREHKLTDLTSLPPSKRVFLYSAKRANLNAYMWRNSIQPLSQCQK